MDLKEQAAKEATKLINGQNIVGLGDGSTIAYMISFLKPMVERRAKMQFVSSSASTRQLLLQNGFPLQPISAFDRIDIYFDGCDQVDKDLNALKSGGGIHTMEKLLASMAKQFVIVGDESKSVDRLDNRFPVVLELIPQAVGYVPAVVQHLFAHSRNAYRGRDKEEGYTITENGNYLLDVWMDQWPDLQLLNSTLRQVTGVVETSLFYKLAHLAIIAGKSGTRILRR